MSNEYKKKLMDKCDEQGQPHSIIDSGLYENYVTLGVLGYSAQEVARNLLYQYTNYNETITFSSLPIYHLDVGRRITIRDIKSGISGDYIINSISLPLSPTSTMNISASRALNRI